MYVNKIQISYTFQDLVEHSLRNFDYGSVTFIVWCINLSHIEYLYYCMV